MTSNPRNTFDEPASPPPADPGPEFAGDLRRLTGSSIVVPTHVDQLILDAARSRLARRSRSRRWQVAAGWAAAAAACLTVAGWFALAGPRFRYGGAPAITAQIAGDLDGNGRVDILDAFLLARAIDAGTPPAAGDFNHDGRLDQVDVDALAGIAVALPKGTT